MDKRISELTVEELQREISATWDKLPRHDRIWHQCRTQQILHGRNVREPEYRDGLVYVYRLALDRLNQLHEAFR